MSSYSRSLLAQKITEWLELDWPTDIPSEVCAFCFNLTGWSDRERGCYDVEIELIGADRFSTTDTDWPCSEIWEFGNPRSSLALPEACSTGRWDNVLAEVSAALSELLSDQSKIASELKSKSAVALGFVDGDLKLLHKAYS